MDDGTQTLITVLMIGFLLVLMILPQWRARRRHAKKMQELRPGDRVMTVGGIIGTLKFFDAEHEQARLEIASGVQIEIIPAAIGRKVEE